MSDKDDGYLNFMRQEITKEIEALYLSIQLGKGRSIVRAVEKLTQSRVPREYASQVGNLCWKAGRADLGIKFLRAFLRPSKNPLPQEITEYAACLIRVGAHSEARLLLDRIDSKDAPKALLYRAFLSMGGWFYNEAIPLLQQYLASPNLSYYDRLIGNTKLLAAFGYERDGRFDALFAQLVDELCTGPFTLLLSKSYLLAAIQYFYRREFSACNRMLEQVGSTLEHSTPLDALVLRKWKSFLFLAQNQSGALGEVQSVRSEATKQKHWETVRDCDRWQSILTSDKSLLLYVYFGTPYWNFRKWVLADFPAHVEIPPTYSWLGATSVPSSLCLIFDPSNDRWDGMRKGMILHRLFSALCSDFYRPQSIPALFENLFHGEKYNPNTSQARVHQAIRRLKRWLKNNEIPLKLHFSGNGYTVEHVRPCKVVLSNPEHPSFFWRHEIKMLFEAFSFEPFSFNQAQARVGIPRRSLTRILGEAREKRILEREGNGQNTKLYIFLAPHCPLKIKQAA